MNVLFSGNQCSGKTSLLNFINERHNKNFKIIEESATKSIINHKDIKNSKIICDMQYYSLLQYDIIKRDLKNIMNYRKLSSDKVLLFDRSLLDSYIFCKYFIIKYNINYYILSKSFELFRKYLDFFDKFVFLEKLDFYEDKDNIRDDNMNEDEKLIYNLYQDIYKTFNIDVITLDKNLSIEERFLKLEDNLNITI